MSAIHHTQEDARPEANRPVDKIATSQGVQFRLRHPHMLFMSEWQPPRREPKKTKAEKTKAELREMLAKAVRNTAQLRAEAAAEDQERSWLTRCYQSRGRNQGRKQPGSLALVRSR